MALKSPNLKSAFTLENLEKAWFWLLTNADGKYKKYFRSNYAAYASALRENLEDLRKKLLNGSYQPEKTSKVFTPKKSGILRPYTLLTVEDQIVYQALANVVAERFSKKVKPRYNKKVFGNLYQGKKALQFYKNWKACYTGFSQALGGMKKAGYGYLGAFDLVAFYDSIEHCLLRKELLKYKVDEGCCDFLLNCLQTWMASEHDHEVLAHDHGIPQGPLSSGLFSELILANLDDFLDKQKNLKYLRYVDDLRLFAKDSETVQKGLQQLDLLSKSLGLYPQLKKQGVHKFAHLDEEINSVSGLLPERKLAAKKYQVQMAKKVLALLGKTGIKNETQFKYLLASCAPQAALSARLLRLLPLYPHLHESILNYFAAYSRFNQKQGAAFLAMLKERPTYFSFSAGLIDLLRDRCGLVQKARLQKICKAILKNPSHGLDPALRTAAIAVLIRGKQLSGKALEKAVLGSKDWWVRAQVQNYLDPALQGTKEYAKLLQKLMRDKVCDPASIAANHYLRRGFKLIQLKKQLNPNAKTLLKSAMKGPRLKKAGTKADGHAKLLKVKFPPILPFRLVQPSKGKTLLHRV